LRAFEARTAARTGVYSYERDVEDLTDDELARFRAEPAAWSYWEARPASYRKAALHWVTTAKQPATRERRLAALVEDSKAGRLVKPLTPPRTGT
jgi:uncharacterized protein YdeI (YjbR/CyaY-like superfamily)